MQVTDDTAVGEEDRPVRVRRGDGVVRDHHDGLAELAHGLAHEREDLGARAGVEVAGGLVGEDDLGPAGQRPRHRDALLLTTGELRRPVREATAETDGADDLVDPRAVRPVPGESHREDDVLRRGQRRDQVERLEHEPDPVAPQLGELAVVERAEVGVTDPDAAVGEVVEAGERVHERRLAGTGRAHDRREAGRLEVDGDAVEGADLGLTLAVDLDRVDGAGGRRRVGCRGVTRFSGGFDRCGHLALLFLGPVSHRLPALVFGLLRRMRERAPGIVGREGRPPRRATDIGRAAGRPAYGWRRTRESAARPMRPGPAPRYREAVTAGERFQEIREWFRRLNPWVVDGALAALFVVLGLASTAGRGQVPRVDYEPSDAFSVFLVLAIAAPAVFRRRAPLTVLLVSAAALTLLVALGHNEGLTPFFLWVYSITVGAMCTLRKTAIAAVAVFAALALLVAVDAPGFDIGTFAGNAALFAAMFMFGITLRNRKERVTALEERAVAVEREKEEEARRAVADERLHIARELHDVVAHSMGVIAVQASVGEHVIDDNPEEAKRALEAISGVSRSTLAEIRRMLGVLRETDDEERGLPVYAPAPGLSELDRLVRELDGAGIAVEVAYDGARVELPPGVDLTAYRIVQEALTNVMKHAGPARARVVVRYEPGALGLEIVDDGRGVNGRSEGRGGHGLVGMRERVAVYGGTLEVGPKPGGGFRVAARLPYEDDAV